MNGLLIENPLLHCLPYFAVHFEGFKGAYFYGNYWKSAKKGLKPGIFLVKNGALKSRISEKTRFLIVASMRFCGGTLFYTPKTTLFFT